jgi:transmembrane sensor
MTTDSREPRDVNATTLARYLSGEADRDERARVERWVAADSERRAVAEALRAAWDRPSAPAFDPEDAVWRRIRDRITAPERRPALVTDGAASSPRRQVRLVIAPRPRRWLAAAALLAAAVGATLVVRTDGALSKVGLWPRATSAGLREMTTRRSERLALRLADGTRVVLAPESRLRLADNFSAHGRGPREVYLEGEALFSVVHDSARPFRVRTPASIAEDLGTEFVVTSYPETGGTRVVVASGVVALRRPERGGDGPVLVTLGAGDLGMAEPTRVTTVERGIDLRRYTSWAEGALVFDGTPLREALPALRRWYDLDLRLGDSALAEQKLTAEFHEEPVSQVLSLVAMSLDLTVEQRAGVITLRAKGGQRSAR